MASPCSGGVGADVSRAPARAFVLGTVLTLTLIVAFIAPRAIPYALLAVLAGLSGAAAAHGRLKDLVRCPDPAVAGLLAFLLYAVVSALWAVEPRITLEKTLLAAAVVLGTVVIERAINEEPPPVLAHLSRAIWIGFAIGMGYLFIELVSGCVIVRSFMYLSGLDVIGSDRFHQWQDGKFQGISREFLTRSIAPVTPLLWPAMMATLYGTARPFNVVVATALFLLALAVVALSAHETSKLAIIAGSAVFVLARLALPWVQRLVPLAWGAACLLMLPLVVLAYKANLDESPWLQESAQARIVIWHSTARRIIERPLLGIGAEMTYVVGQQEGMRAAVQDGAERLQGLSRHAHNLYLQTWFELGLVGAVLLTFAGLGVLGAIRRLAPSARSFAYATFASVATVSASSYGMWQTWFLASFALAVVALAAGTRCLMTAPVDAAS